VPGLDLHQTWGTADRPYSDAPLNTPEWFDHRDHIADIGLYADEDAPIVIVNAETGERHPFWSELDTHADTTDDRRALILRPAVNFDHGTRYIVALRNLKGADGKTIEPREEFLAYREGTASGPRAAQMEEIFETLRHAGIGRNRLYLAWDFTVASERNVTERMLAIRDDALGRVLGDSDPADGIVDGDAPEFTVDSTSIRDDGQWGPYRRVAGRVTVPNYMDRPQENTEAATPRWTPYGTAVPGGRLFYGAEGPLGDALPQQNPALPEVHVPYTCDVPLELGRTETVLYGHGLLGTRDQIGDAKWPRRHGMTSCAADWWGMASEDLPTVAAILLDFSNFPSLPDRAQQGFLNFIFLGRAAVHPDGFATHEAFRSSGGEDILLTATPHERPPLHYDGNSQGGIMGAALVAISPDIQRGILGVPGMNYSTLLNRSVDWEGAYGDVFYIPYGDPMERQLIFGLIQMLWDRGEANGYAHGTTDRPIHYPDGRPASPPHDVMLQVAWSDHQVTVHAAEVMARTYGAPIMLPGLETDGHHWEFEPYFSPTATYPYRGSSLIYWDSGNARPPNGNVPATHSRDPHGDPRNDEAGGWQEAQFLRTGWNVDVCDGGPYITTRHPRHEELRRCSVPDWEPGSRDF
jgi:hypothetical protein